MPRILSTVLLVALAAGPALAAGAAGAPDVAVQEQEGIYVVTARFDVPQTPAIVRAVLTDYERIPRFMPGVRKSVVRERAGARVVVEQEAVSRFLLFSRTVYLLLDVTEDATVLRFIDTSRRSFSSYQGAWTLTEASGGTVVDYELSARPGFDVPRFVLMRLLENDSAQMIERLRREIATRTP
jgi:carbon monoxide dehydrogenase subunit G